MGLILPHAAILQICSGFALSLLRAGREGTQQPWHLGTGNLSFFYLFSDGSHPPRKMHVPVSVPDVAQSPQGCWKRDNFTPSILSLTQHQRFVLRFSWLPLKCKFKSCFTPRAISPPAPGWNGQEGNVHLMELYPKLPPVPAGLSHSGAGAVFLGHKWSLSLAGSFPQSHHGHFWLFYSVISICAWSQDSNPRFSSEHPDSTKQWGRETGAGQ